MTQDEAKRVRTEFAEQLNSYSRPIPAKIITVNPERGHVAVLPIDVGVSHIPVQVVIIPLSAFPKVPKIAPDMDITYSIQESEFIVHSVGVST